MVDSYLVEETPNYRTLKLRAMSALPFLYVAPDTHGGRGVFTGAEILEGTTIELAEVLLLSAADRAVVHKTSLHDFYFQWDGDRAAIALGYGSLYNHSDKANTIFELDYDFKQIRFIALRDIASGEEIMTNYRAGEPEMKLWF